MWIQLRIYILVFCLSQLFASYIVSIIHAQHQSPCPVALVTYVLHTSGQNITIVKCFYNLQYQMVTHDVKHYCSPMCKGDEQWFAWRANFDEKQRRLQHQKFGGTKRARNILGGKTLKKSSGLTTFYRKCKTILLEGEMPPALPCRRHYNEKLRTSFLVQIQTLR